MQDDNVEPPETTLAPPERSEPEPLDTSESPDSFTAKQVRKLLKSEEERLRKELQRYKEMCKKARHSLVVSTVIEDREKVKKAQWMFDSIKHYLKDSDKKALKSDVALLSPTFHQSAEQSIEDLKLARRRIKSLLKATDESEIRHGAEACDIDP